MKIRAVLFFLLLMFILAFLLTGCGAGGSTGGGSAGLVDLSGISSNSADLVLNIGGVFSGETGAVSAPSRVYSESNLEIRLIYEEKGIENYIIFPLLSKNCFYLSGIPRVTDHYIIRLYRNGTLFADLPLNLEDYSYLSELTVMNELLYDNARDRLVATQMYKKYAGAEQTFKRILIERDGVPKTSALDFSVTSIAEYSDLLLNDIISHYEGTSFASYTFPDQFFYDFVLRKIHDSESYHLSADQDAAAFNDPFYNDRSTINSNLSDHENDLKVSSLKILLGESKDQNLPQISMNKTFYATLVFNEVTDKELKPMNFFLKITATAGSDKAEKTAYFSQGKAYRQDGTKITSIESSSTRYYITYSALSDYVTINVATSVTFKVEAYLSDGTIIRSTLNKMFVP